MLPDFFRTHPVGVVTVQYISRGDGGWGLLDEFRDLHILARTVINEASRRTGSRYSRVQGVVDVKCHHYGRILKKHIERCPIGVEGKAIKFGQRYLRVESEAPVLYCRRVDRAKKLVVEALEVDGLPVAARSRPREPQCCLLLCMG